MEKHIGVWEASETWVWWMHWTCITGMKPAYYLMLFWSMWCLEILFPRILCIGPVLYPEEIYDIVSHLIFSMSFYTTFKKKTLACRSQEGHMWVTSRLLCGSVGQQVWPTFNPAVYSYLLIAFQYNRIHSYKLSGYILVNTYTTAWNQTCRSIDIHYVANENITFNKSHLGSRPRHLNAS